MIQKSSKSFQNRIFIQTLGALIPSELKAFQVFCNDIPDFSEKTKSLLEYICKVYPQFEKLNEEALFLKFFPANSKAKIQLNYALHDLYTLLRKWMIQKELEADEYLQNKLLIRACKKQFLHQQFFKKNRQTLDVLEDDFLEVPDTWQKRFDTNFQLFYHVQTPKNQEVVESFSDMEINLDLYYYGSKIRSLCQKIYRRRNLNNLSEIEAKEIELILDFAQNKGTNIPFFKLYAQLIKYLQNPEMATLVEFIKNFKKDRTQIERLDQSLLLSIAAYSLNPYTMKGDQITLKTQFDLFKYAFDKDLVLFDNEMDAAFFNNFILTAGMLGEFQIARKMLKKYEPYFRPDIREEFTSLMWGTIYYYQRKYEKVEINLYNFRFKNPSFRIRSRNLLLKSLYERYQKDKTLKDLVLSELVKLRKYIQKQNSISESRKEMYYTMISVIRKLTNASHRRPFYRAKAKQELLDFFSDASNKPLSRDWLLEKIKLL